MPAQVDLFSSELIAPISPLRPDETVAPLPMVNGGFTTVLADPPWRFTNRTGKVAPEHRRLDRYSTMSLNDIASLPVTDACGVNAHCYLWVPNALLVEGLHVLKAWGFRYVSNVVWAKRRKDGGPDGRGVGFYFRNVTELLLFGVRGSLRTLPPARSQVNMIESRKREHSRKPDEQYELIENCSPGPFLELFARYPRAGWHAWGNEAGADGPQGRVHRGYEGGPLDAPILAPNERLLPGQHDMLAHVLRDRYESGESIRDLQRSTGYSITRVRGLLESAGTSFRRAGRPRIVPKQLSDRGRTFVDG